MFTSCCYFSVFVDTCNSNLIIMESVDFKVFNFDIEKLYTQRTQRTIVFGACQLLSVQLNFYID